MNSNTGNISENFTNLFGQTLFMSKASRVAILIIRTNKRMHKRKLKFENEYAALDWCLNRKAAFVLVPQSANNNSN